MTVSRRLVALVLGALSFSMLYAPKPASAAVDWLAPFGPGNHLIVDVPTSCLDDETLEVVTDCPPELHMRMYGQGTAFEEQWEEIGGALRDASGQPVPLKYQHWSVSTGSSWLDPNYGSQFVEVLPAEPLPAGTYSFKLNYRTDGFWHCSIYDPDGCSWISGERWAKFYKFRWDGSTRVQQPPYRSPYASVSQVKFRRDSRRLRVTGLVTGRLETAGFRLAAAAPLRGARVLLKSGGRTVASSRTGPMGRFALLQPATRRADYRLVVVATPRYRGVSRGPYFNR